MAISLEDIDAELSRRQGAGNDREIGNVPSIEDIDAELVRRGAVRQDQPDSWINRAANVSQGAQDAVMQPIVRGVASGAKALSRGAFGTEEPANMLGRGIQAVGQGIQTGEEYVSGKLGEMGVNPYIAGAVPIAGEMAASMLLPGPKGLPRSAARGVEDLAAGATRSADSRWFKAIGGTLPQAKELGAEETLRIGRTARNKGVVTPWNSTESQQKVISQGLQQSGKRIEELRGLGDLYGDSPEAMKIVQAIKQDLGPKYGTGIRSGEAGELDKAIQEVLKLEPIDKLTATEEMVPRMASGSIEHGVPSSQADPFGAMSHSQFPPKESYEKFRAFQEDPNFIPEYDFRRPTTFNEVSKVSTDLNQYAKGQSKLLQPSGATTDAANVVTKLNNEKLLNVLPKEKGQEYLSNLKDYSDFSTMDRINEIKNAYEVGGSRNGIINNIANRIYQKFGHQLTASALDKIAGVLRAIPRTGSVAARGIVPISAETARQAYASFIDKVTTGKQ